MAVGDAALLLAEFAVFVFCMAALAIAIEEWGGRRNNRARDMLNKGRDEQ